MKKFLFTIIISLCTTGIWADSPKRLLSTLCQSAELEQYLAKPGEFHPVPIYKDPYWLDSIPEEMRKSYIREAEKMLGKPWYSTDIALFSEYRGNGDRIRYQRFIYAKRNQLNILAMGELMEGKGRFLNSIMNGLFSVCEETWWGVPAHYGPNTPLAEQQSMDLFSAETGGMMAWMLYMFREPIKNFSTRLETRIQQEINRRILTEGAKKKEWWRGAAMNWNPWICSNWMVCVLFAESDLQKQKKYLQLIAQSLDGFIDNYPEDGGCDEGPGYWDCAAGSLFECLNIMAKATNGWIDLSKNAKINKMADYLCKMNIGNGYFVNFADASPKITPHIDWFPSAWFIKNEELMRMIAETARQRDYFTDPAKVYTNNYFYSFGRELMLLTQIDKLKSQPAGILLHADSWLPAIQVLTARSKKNSTDGLYMAVKGGNNGESHNHNDVGNIIVYADGTPLIIDVGVGTYRKETFNDKTRYGIWCMQSGYHNVPVINGVEQMNGSKFKACRVSSSVSSRKVTFKADIASAYPKEAAVKSWVRTVTLTRGKSIAVKEEYKLEKNTGKTSLSLMTQTKPVVTAPGNIDLQVNHKTYHLTYNPQALRATVEELELTDEKFVNLWGHIYRIRLELFSKQNSGNVTWTVTQ